MSSHPHQIRTCSRRVGLRWYLLASAPGRASSLVTPPSFRLHGVVHFSGPAIGRPPFWWDDAFLRATNAQDVLLSIYSALSNSMVYTPAVARFLREVRRWTAIHRGTGFGTAGAVRLAFSVGLRLEARPRRRPVGRYTPFVATPVVSARPVTVGGHRPLRALTGLEAVVGPAVLDRADLLHRPGSGSEPPAEPKARG